LKNPNIVAASVLLSLLLTGCATSMTQNSVFPLTMTASQVFTSSMVGETWTFQNSYGDITIIDIQAAPMTDYVPTGCTVWHFSKTVARAYWSPGTPSAENWQIVCPAADGSSYAIGNLTAYPNGCSYCSGPFFFDPGSPAVRSRKVALHHGSRGGAVRRCDDNKHGLH
jgi:hypothetical protein